MYENWSGKSDFVIIKNYSTNSHDILWRGAARDQGVEQGFFFLTFFNIARYFVDVSENHLWILMKKWVQIQIKIRI